MKYRRICIETKTHSGQTFTRGREYTTGPVKFGTCSVYIRAKEIPRVPASIFAAAERVN